MLLAHGVRRAHPVAVELPELGDGGVDVEGACLGRCGHVGSPSAGHLDTLKCRESQPKGNAPKEPQCATSTIGAYTTVFKKYPGMSFADLAREAIWARLPMPA